jgi:sialic acid synthase SpsE
LPRQEKLISTRVMDTNSMKIGHRIISDKTAPLIVAELGINHGGCLQTAKEMVLHAAKSGCECVKHQTHFVDDEMTDEARSIYPPNAKTSIWNVIEKAALSADEEFELKEYSESLGLIYLSTPFSRCAANFLNEIGVKAFKIGSGEADNLPLIEHIAKFGKPIIMSTGMHSLNNLENSVDIFEKYGLEYALLECTSAYPTPPETVRLSAIAELRQKFPRAVVGFSDHSIGTTMSIAASALGAKIIEKHFTDSRYREGPDIVCSMDPAELRLLIDRSMEIHQALQSKKEQLSIEKSVYQFARSSIVADRDIKKGQKIMQKDIWARRPGNGEIAGYDYSKVLGKTAIVDIAKNKQLSWNDLR